MPLLNLSLKCEILSFQMNKQTEVYQTNRDKIKVLKMEV